VRMPMVERTLMPLIVLFVLSLVSCPVAQLC
jgi:hypothetical protein